MFASHRSWVNSALLLLLLSARPAGAQFTELAALVPETANAIVLLDAQKVMASPLAAREGWKDRYDQAFASGLYSIAPDTKRMIFASQLDYEYMQPHWELAIGDFADERTVAEIARKTKGTMDQIANLPVVALTDNSYCIQLAPTRLGVMAPANRQTIARWVQTSNVRKEPMLTPYLKGTLSAAETSQVVVAFDLQDAIPPNVIRGKLDASSTLAGKKVDLDAVAAALTQLRGFVFEVSIAEGSFGRLLVHFNSDASVLAPFAKPLILEVLGGMGAMIDDIKEWEVKTEPQRFTLHGPLSEAGRKRVLSLIDHPTAALIASKPLSSQATTQANQAAQATQQYFKSITSMMDDLRGKWKDAKTFGENAMWLDNWSRKIDRLPILNVDPEMLAYGRYTTARMRDASASLKGIGINSAAREAQVYQQYSTTGTSYGGVGGYGYGGGYSYYTQYNNVGGERRAIRAEERAQGASQAQSITREWENETAKIRQAMSQKYQINF